MPRFASFFHGTLSRQDRACLGSFARAGHEIAVYSYEPLDLPQGVERRDASEILPRDRMFVADMGAHRGTVTQFSNLFRYMMIRETGRTWVDSDVICLDREWPDREITIGWQDGFLMNNAVLHLPSDHPALDRAITVAERLAGVSVWGLTGPHLWTALAWDFGFQASALPPDVFYPIHHSKAGQLLRPLQPGERLELPANAQCVHLWNEVLRMLGHDRHQGPPAGSALAVLLDYAEGK